MSNRHTTKRPSWAQTHHTKPRRASGRRERQQLRAMKLETAR